jgi:acetyl-CoA acetyltransferase family protein
MAETLIISGARTPFAIWKKGTRGDGTEGGKLAECDPYDLAAASVKGAMAKAGVGPDKIERVVFANAYHAGQYGVYGGRYVVLRSGLPFTITNLTVNQACGAGLQSVISGADEIRHGDYNLVAACGADVPSQIPRNVFVPSFNDWAAGRPIAQTSQTCSAALGFARKDQDAWALKSHERALKARTAGYFAQEIVPAGQATEDDGIQNNPTAEHFANSKILFEDSDLGATSANTHAIVDGGSALLLASPKAAAGLPVLGRYIGGTVVSVDPQRMAYGSVEAIRALLPKISWTAKDIDLWEINETFASQMLVAFKELQLPEDKVNVNGGALALGHPFGGTGCRITLTLLNELKRRNLKRGIAAICVGGGSGIAVAVESA